MCEPRLILDTLMAWITLQVCGENTKAGSAMKIASSSALPGH
jgi:hypothetical protein